MQLTHYAPPEVLISVFAFISLPPVPHNSVKTGSPAVQWWEQILWNEDA